MNNMNVKACYMVAIVTAVYELNFPVGISNLEEKLTSSAVITWAV